MEFTHAENERFAISGGWDRNTQKPHMPCNCFGYCANRREKWPSRKGSAETRQLLKNPRPPQNDKRNDKRNWPASASVITSNEPTTCWSGGTGRRTGLKIPRPSLGMWVRPPPPAPNNPFSLNYSRLKILACRLRPTDSDHDVDGAVLILR